MSWLRWLSNADKHRAVRVVGRTAFDVGPIIFDGEQYEIVEDTRFTGPLENNAVVARLKFKRPVGVGRSISLIPTFAYSPAIQVSEDDDLLVPLHIAMEAMRQQVCDVIDASTTVLGAERPAPDDLELGMDHAAVALENVGVIATFRDHEGTVHRISEPTSGDDDVEEPRS